MSGNRKTKTENTNAVYQRNKRSRDRHLEEEKPGARIRNNPDYDAIIRKIRDKG